MNTFNTVPSKLKNLTLSALITSSALLLAGCELEDDNDDPVVEAGQVVASECFWVGPYVRENPKTNYAFPDTGAAYWSAAYTLPEGASIKLHGDYPKARYMSLNSYNAEGVPTSALMDAHIQPNEGSSNPYIQGADRTVTQRSYQVQIQQQAKPEQPQANTLYDNVNAGDTSMILYRVYVPDNGEDTQGGVALPSIELTMADGRTLYAEDACDELNVAQQEIDNIYIPAATYQFTRIAHDPADYPTLWTAPYNVPFTLRCGFMGQCDGNPERNVAFFANLDNHYVAAFVNRQFGEVVVTRGKLPAVTSTENGVTVFDESESQLRYWSICQNEFYSQKVTDCIYDENVIIDDDGYYTIITAKGDDKPINATEACGVGYLPWPEDGDGYGTLVGTPEANNYDDALLLVRNMAPLNGFVQTPQQTQTPGDELSVMGEYLPTTEYMTKAQFEALGCPVQL